MKYNKNNTTINGKKVILFIAPLPPPITGVSNASKEIINGLNTKFVFLIVDFSKRTLKQNVKSLTRFYSIIKVFIKILKYTKQSDIVYLTLSQSLAGNLKDLVILFLTRKNKQIVHLHGGGIKKLIYDKHPFLYKVNIALLNRVNKIIVLSDSLKSIYHDINNHENIISIPNFAENSLFLSLSKIRRKYSQPILRILYLSNLIEEKGYNELLESVKELNKENLSIKIQLDFAGAFDCNIQKEIFLNDIKSRGNITYHGVVEGKIKSKLLEGAHVFCLPTYYRYEGQPISILEAYASGCIVITTNQGGIGDIFEDKINGFLVKPHSINDIIRSVKRIIKLGKEERYRIGSQNMQTCREKYSEAEYLKRIYETFQE